MDAGSGGDGVCRDGDGDDDAWPTCAWQVSCQRLDGIRTQIPFNSIMQLCRYFSNISSRLSRWAYITETGTQVLFRRGRLRLGWGFSRSEPHVAKLAKLKFVHLCTATCKRTFPAVLF